MNLEALWYADSPRARLSRAAVTPLSWLYGSLVTARNSLYDRQVLRVHPSKVPVISVGNLTVGGTGKTPFSAYLVRELLAAGHKPAIVMRGYGNDELQLHARMNSAIPVVEDRDRVAAIGTAAAMGCDVVVMDDGFQHRRAARDLDIVLIGAERWNSRLRMLPAGPLREPVAAIRRADLLVVTQKSATNDEVERVAGVVRHMRGLTAGIAVARMEPAGLESCTRDGITAELQVLRGSSVLAIAGIGDPTSFFAQLRQLGAVVSERRFPDHHPYRASDVQDILARAVGHKYVVCTQKDAVKLGPLWPAKSRELWYLSQAVRITKGASLVAAALANLFQRATSIA